MKLIKLKKKTESRIHQLQLLIRVYCTLKEISLSKVEVDIFSYFIQHGINEKTKALIYRSELLHSPNTYHNIIYKFKKLGLIEGIRNNDDTRGYQVRDTIFHSMDNNTALMIQLDNS